MRRGWHTVLLSERATLSLPKLGNSTRATWLKQFTLSVSALTYVQCNNASMDSISISTVPVSVSGQLVRRVLSRRLIEVA